MSSCLHVSDRSTGQKKGWYDVILQSGFIGKLEQWGTGKLILRKCGLSSVSLIKQAQRWRGDDWDKLLCWGLSHSQCAAKINNKKKNSQSSSLVQSWWGPGRERERESLRGRRTQCGRAKKRREGGDASVIFPPFFSLSLLSSIEPRNKDIQRSPNFPSNLTTVSDTRLK